MAIVQAEAPVGVTSGTIIITFANRETVDTQPISLQDAVVSTRVAHLLIGGAIALGERSRYPPVSPAALGTRVFRETSEYAAGESPALRSIRLGSLEVIAEISRYLGAGSFLFGLAYLVRVVLDLEIKIRTRDERLEAERAEWEAKLAQDRAHKALYDVYAEHVREDFWRTAALNVDEVKVLLDSSADENDDDANDGT